MSIALESGPGLGGGRRFGRITRCAYAASPPASAGRSSSPVGRDSDSPAAAARWEWDGEEVEGGDGEVQSSSKGPFDTMDALPFCDHGIIWLPILDLESVLLLEIWEFLGRSEVNCKKLEMYESLTKVMDHSYSRKGVSKFYNGKSGSCAKLPDSVTPSPPGKGLPKSEKPSPRKRKDLLPFSFKWGKPQNKEVFPEYVGHRPHELQENDTVTSCHKQFREQQWQ
ncbi:hypothetical protein ABZP36_021015 [Zizania latifolia]